MATVFSEREYDQERKAQKRAAGRDLVIPKVKDPKRRAALEADDCEWLKTYVPHVFRFPFTSDQRLIVEYVGKCLEYGLTKCIAAPRHDGKTSIARYLTLKYTLQRIERNGVLVPKVPLSLLLSATGPKSKGSLAAIKQKLRGSRPGDLMFDDYPLECVVAKYVAPAPARCNNVTAKGKAIRVEWGADHIILPSFEDEEWLGGMLSALGITSNELQGFNLYDTRPRFCMLDDLDDRDSLASQDGGTIAGKIETIIDENVAGLGGPGEPLGLVMLCTIPSRKSVAFKYSDPQQKPSWSGVRMQKIKAWPEKMDWWETYMAKRESGKQLLDEFGRPLDEHGRGAHQWLLEHLDGMHHGALVSNENDFIRAMLPPDAFFPEGSPTQISALQNCFDYIADKGMPSFMTECQNDPPLEDGPQESGITDALVASREHGYPRGVTPADSRLAIGLDIGDDRFHWAAVAADDNAAYYVVEYGFEEDSSDLNIELRKLPQTDPRRVAAVQKKILRRLLNFRDYIASRPFKTETGAIVDPSFVLVDSGSGVQQRVVYHFCKEFGMPFVPSKGFGSGQARFDPAKPKPHHKYGERWIIAPQETSEFGRFKLYEFDATDWKRQVHARFITPTFDEDGKANAGALSLWKPSESNLHRKFARQICAEVWVKHFVPGKKEKEGWETRRKDNHWLDATAMACVGLSMAGVRVIGSARKRSYKSMSEMQAQARK